MRPALWREAVVSAYMVDNAHIDALIDIARQYERE